MLFVTAREPSVPTLVSEDDTTPVPRVVALRTEVLLILYTFPLARFKFSEAPQLSPVASKLNVLSPSPESTVKPAPFAAASSAAPVATWKFLSSMATVVELIVVVVPFTVRFPEMTALSAIVVVPPLESIVRLPDDVDTVLPFIVTLSAAMSPVTVRVPTTFVVSKSVVPSTSRFPLKSALPASVRVDAMSTAPSMSTASRFVVPSMSIEPDISRLAAVTVPANVALPLLKIVAFSPIGVSAPRVLTPAISIPTLCKLEVPVLTVVSSIVTVPLPTDMMPVTRISPRTMTSVLPVPTVSLELLTSKVPMIAAFSSTSSVSICAVPSMNRSFHSNVDAPMSLAPSVEGTNPLSKRPVAVMVSLVALPRSTFPFATNPPVTVASPLTVKLSSTATVPPAESNVRFPDSVSISLSPVSPTLILPKDPPSDSTLSR